MRRTQRGLTLCRAVTYVACDLLSRSPKLSQSLLCDTGEVEPRIGSTHPCLRQAQFAADDVGTLD
jgi:hypothetical protein